MLYIMSASLEMHRTPWHCDVLWIHTANRWWQSTVKSQSSISTRRLLTDILSAQFFFASVWISELIIRYEGQPMLMESQTTCMYTQKFWYLISCHAVVFYCFGLTHFKFSIHVYCFPSWYFTNSLPPIKSFADTKRSRIKFLNLIQMENFNENFLHGRILFPWAKVELRSDVPPSQSCLRHPLTIH